MLVTPYGAYLETWIYKVPPPQQLNTLIISDHPDYSTTIQLYTGFPTTQLYTGFLTIQLYTGFPTMQLYTI